MKCDLNYNCESPQRFFFFPGNRCLVYLCLIFFAAAATAAAQNRVPVKPEQVAPLSETDSSVAASQYRIGIGDVLDIRVYNRPQLSREAVRVDGRGMIRMPLVETDIRAVCRTDSELAAEIEKLYLEYLRNPHVEVFIKDFQSKPVAVIGAVREPGRFQLQRRVRLLELITFAGGPTEQAGGRIQVKHDAGVQTCRKEPAGDSIASSAQFMTDSNFAGENVTWYEISDLLGESADKNPFVREGDIVNLIEADKVYVVGNVVKPSIIPLKQRVTLTQAIAFAGGTLPQTNLDRVKIIRQSADGVSKTELTIDLKAINRKKADDPVLLANDIIEVPTSSGKKIINSLLNTISPTISRLPVRIIP
jgi:polysaccharide export outer membrane protein